MKTLTPAAVNRALDKINAKPEKNPRAKRTAAQWKAEIAKIETMVKNADNRAAYDAARWLYDEAQDEYTKSANAAQMKLRKIMEDLNESRYGNPARKTRAVRVVAANPVKTAIKTVRRKSLVGGNYWAVLFYANKDKPSGKPDITYPAPSKESARHFVTSLEKAGASGVAILEFTKARVS